MAYSFSETRFSRHTVAVPSSAVRRQLWATALRAHRQVCGAEPAASAWRPSLRLLDALTRVLAPADTFSYPAPGRSRAYLYSVNEPDHPAWGDQLKRLEEDFVELSSAHRELVIEFMKLLREQSRLVPPERDDE